jgi:hypothetical protein
VGSRRYLIAWLTAWRKENGLADSGRRISNRSLPQLQKMYEEAQRGKQYRAGRRWGPRNLAPPSVGITVVVPFLLTFSLVWPPTSSRTSPPARSGAPVTGVCTSGRCASSRAPTRPRWWRCRFHPLLSGPPPCAADRRAQTGVSPSSERGRASAARCQCALPTSGG